jgi:hypothetical protein
MADILVCVRLLERLESRRGDIFKDDLSITKALPQGGNRTAKYELAFHDLRTFNFYFVAIFTRLIGLL